MYSSSLVIRASQIVRTTLPKGRPSNQVTQSFSRFDQWKALSHYLDLANTRYTGGVTSYLEATTAQSAALSDELTAVNILGRHMVDAVMLVQAPGGGWDRSSLPDRPECCGKLTSNSR
jgi:hypothetical protein